MDRRLLNMAPKMNPETVTKWRQKWIQKLLRNGAKLMRADPKTKYNEKR